MPANLANYQRIEFKNEGHSQGKNVQRCPIRVLLFHINSLNQNQSVAMKTELKRRDFIVKSCRAGVACCALLAGSRLGAFGAMTAPGRDDNPNPKKLNYCGYTCPADCKMKRATLENNVDLKKEAYADWRIEQKYGIAFDPEQIFCYGCKTSGKPLGLVVAKCTVRNCAIDKGHDCCIQCDQLTGCDKEIWSTFPDFHNAVIEMQKRYRGA